MRAEVLGRIGAAQVRAPSRMGLRRLLAGTARLRERRDEGGHGHRDRKGENNLIGAHAAPSSP